MTAVQMSISFSEGEVWAECITRVAHLLAKKISSAFSFSCCADMGLLLIQCTFCKRGKFNQQIKGANQNDKQCILDPREQVYLVAVISPALMGIKREDFLTWMMLWSIHLKVAHSLKTLFSSFCAMLINSIYL